MDRNTNNDYRVTGDTLQASLTQDIPERRKKKPLHTAKSYAIGAYNYIF